MRVWAFHWLSAALVLAMLLTALPLTGLSAFRPPARGWAGIHLTMGWTLAGLTLVRLAALPLARNAWPRPGNPSGWRSALKITLLTFVVLVIVTGTLVYRPAPLQKPVILFGLIEAGPIVNLDHALHLQLIAVHRIASYLLAAMLALHAGWALKPLTPASWLPISWIWLGRWPR